MTFFRIRIRYRNLIPASHPWRAVRATSSPEGVCTKFHSLSNRSKFVVMLSNRSTGLSALLALFTALDAVSAQRYRRLGSCPTLGCVFPPDQSDFYPGQLFDIRLEVHAPENGREASNGGVSDEKLSFCIRQRKGACVDVSKFFKIQSEPVLEKWSFS